MHGDMNMWFFPGVGFVFFLTVFLYLLYVIFSSKKDKSSESALDILKKRLAKGEISKEEYEDLKEKIL
jgi:putative membrane protein